MPRLIGLPGTSTDKEADFVHSVTAILRSIRVGRAAMTASDEGAINVWINDDGNYRCLAMRFRVTINARTFRTLSEVRTWLKAWLPQIERKAAG